MPIDLQRVQAVFQAVAELSPAERGAALERECGGDAELRRHLEALLKAHDDSAELLAAEQAPTGLYSFVAPPGSVPAAEPGQLFAGRYKLLQQIGEGGMGTVWMADQSEPVKRRVAVKLIRVDHGQSKTILSRFEAERQAIALMDHPHIARLLEAGEAPAHAGGPPTPFFVMELVKGVPLTDFCDAHKLGIQERLQLFMQVCAAVQHAHQKGIIHRDLKPSNILVESHDGKPVPKIIDFGLAKATSGLQLTEHTLFTAFGSVMGTPLYMAPEQASASALDVDTRTDIYALGIILYELLTGTTPITRATLKETALDEMLKLIREQEVPTPSSRLSSAESAPNVAANRQTEPAKLGRLVKGELDWIVLKALARERDRRYETANGFAKDIERFLNHEPVTAGPPTAAYRLRKFVRRNRGPVLAASLVLLALVAGVVGTSVGLFRATKAREIAEKREAETKAVLEFFESKIIAAARPAGQAGGLGWDVTLRRALETTLPLLDQSFPEQPLVEARLRRTLAVSFGNLGETKIAAAQAERARTIYSKHLGPDHPDTLASMHNLALCYAGLGRQADALKLQEETLALMKTRLGIEDRTTLAAMINLAISYATVGEQDKALRLNKETLAALKAKFGPDHRATLGTMNNLAGVYSNLGRYDDALKVSTETVARSKDRLGPRDRTTLGSMDTLASIYCKRGQHEEAVKLYEETVALMKETLGPEHPVRLSSMHDLAGVYGALGRHTEELKLREETLERRKAKRGLDHPDTLESMHRLARLLATSSDPKIHNSAPQARCRVTPLATPTWSRAQPSFAPCQSAEPCSSSPASRLPR